MADRDDGGPAFPVLDMNDSEGMSLRDWLAGQALVGILAADPEFDFGTVPARDGVSIAAYLVADSMLRARSK